MIFKSILSFFILLFTFAFSANIEVVEDFSDSPKNITTPKIAKVVNKQTPKIKYNAYKGKILPKKVKKHKKVEENNKSKSLDIKKYKVHNKSNIKKSKTNKKAKLVIIMDDISHKFQLNFIKKLHLKITPSIFPPSKMNIRSNKLSYGLKHFMVHLPLQSRSRAMNRMHKTLFVTDSNKHIINRVKEIRKLFPTAKYLNNHTGSKFSENYKKSKVLYKALMDNGFKFVDSKTSQRSKFKKIAKEFGRRYVENNMFLDDKLTSKATLKQIKKAVSLARRDGLAIVICHPHPTTFKALKEAKPYLKSVNLVYIDEVY